MKTNHWTCNFSFNPEEHFGFIYIITNKLIGTKYVGKKGFRSTGKSWKNYTSCCKSLNTDINLNGKNNFSFEIIELYHDKLSLAEREYKLQLELDVLQRLPDGTKLYYNRNIRGEKFDMSGIRMSEETKNKKGLYGSNNHMYDHSKYKFWNKSTNEIFEGTQKEFQVKTCIISADCVSLLKERQFICKDWCLFSNKNRLHANADKTVYKFKHKDGRKIVSTRLVFQRLNNFHNIEVGQLLHGKRKTTKGWSLDL